MSLIRATLFAILLSLTSCSSSEIRPASGIQQILETRNGRFSVWGFRITLCDRHFATVNPADVQIVEDKHGSLVTGLMEWEIKADGKVLEVRFRPGMGDFGSGNDVSIAIDPKCFREQIWPAMPVWRIPTDPL